MSKVFEVTKTKSLPLKRVLKKMETIGARVFQSSSLFGTKNNESCRLHVPGKSTRGVWLTEHLGHWEIKINIFATKQDIELALDLVKTLARLCGGLIYIEGEVESFTIEQFSSYYSEKEISNLYLVGLRFIDVLIEQGQNNCTVSGLKADIQIGKEFLNSLKHDKPSFEVLNERIIDAFLDIQNLESNLIRIPSLMHTTNENDNNEHYSMIVISAEHPQLIRVCDFVILFKKSEDFIRLTFSEFEEHVDFEINKLDESQYIFPNLTHLEFSELYDHLSAFDQPII